MYSVCVIESGKGTHFQLNLFLDFRSSLQKEKISVHNLKATNQCTHFSRIIVMRFEKFLHFRCILFLCTIFARPGRQARDGAALYVYKPGSARVNRICNGVVRLHSLAYCCGTHGKSSQCSCRSRLGARPGRHSDTDTLRVCQVQRNRPALQPGPVPQSGGGPSPHRSFKALFRCQNGYPGNSSRCPDQ